MSKEARNINRDRKRRHIRNGGKRTIPKPNGIQKRRNKRIEW